MASTLRAVRSQHPQIPMEVEVDTLEQLDERVDDDHRPARRRPPDLALAVVQFASFAGDVPAGVAEHARLIGAAADAGASLVLFPQLSVTGYEPEIIDLHGVHLTPDSQVLQPIASVCRSRRVHALIGAPVRSPDRTGRQRTLPEIAVMHAGPDGVINVAYRKQHLDFGEIGIFAPGHSPGHLTIGGWRLVLALGRDVSHPDHVAEAIGAGADAYLVGGLYLLGSRARIDDDLRSVAVREVWAVLSQYAGGTGGGPACGGSGAWARGGREVLRLGTGPEMAVVAMSTQR